MINIKDLKTGNTVMYNGINSSIGNITALVEDLIDGLDYVQIDHRINKKHYCINLAAVVITEDILLKCGFTDTGNNGWWRMTYFTDCSETAEEMCMYYNLSSGRFSIYDIDSDDGASYPVYTSKVITEFHRLQNVVYELCGNILTIN